LAQGQEGCIDRISFSNLEDSSVVEPWQP